MTNAITNLLASLLAWLPSLNKATLVANENVEQVDPNFYASDGKLWAVAGVSAVILIGIFIYLLRTDKMVSRIEKEAKGNTGSE